MNNLEGYLFLIRSIRKNVECGMYVLYVHTCSVRDMRMNCHIQIRD